MPIMYDKFIKRTLDMVISLLLLVGLIPVFFVISLILLFSNQRIIYKHVRPGMNGRLFSLLKFRTMSEQNGIDGILLPDEMRITRFGRILRNTSLDEIPQLFNVLSGHMSIIGPRPLLSEYLGIYNREQLRRLSVRPGITGWAQVNGRNDISWEEKFKLDIWYVENISFLTDLKIILLTIKNVLSAKGISKKGFATTEKFNGRN